MSIHSLKPWTELVTLHPDVESGSLAEAVFAIDLGAIAVGDKDTPAVYREPDAFFAATYLTSDLRLMLKEVLASLAGAAERLHRARRDLKSADWRRLSAGADISSSRIALQRLPDCRDGIIRVLQLIPDPVSIEQVAGVFRGVRDL
jgi:uncharacterized protein